MCVRVCVCICVRVHARMCTCVYQGRGGGTAQLTLSCLARRHGTPHAYKDTDRPLPFRARSDAPRQGHAGTVQRAFWGQLAGGGEVLRSRSPSVSGLCAPPARPPPHPPPPLSQEGSCRSPGHPGLGNARGVPVGEGGGAGAGINCPEHRPGGRWLWFHPLPLSPGPGPQPPPAGPPLMFPGPARCARQVSGGATPAVGAPPGPLSAAPSQPGRARLLPAPGPAPYLRAQTSAWRAAGQARPRTPPAPAPGSWRGAPGPAPASSPLGGSFPARGAPASPPPAS